MTDLRVSLFDVPSDAEAVLANQPGPSRHDNPATSRRAAEKIGFRAGALKHRILVELDRAGAEGANDWELHERCDPRGRVHSAATRRKELQDDFDPPLIVTTAITRPTDAPDSEGLVHLITDAGRRVLAEIEEARRG